MPRGESGSNKFIFSVFFDWWTVLNFFGRFFFCFWWIDFVSFFVSLTKLDWIETLIQFVVVFLLNLSRLRLWIFLVNGRFNELYLSLGCLFVNLYSIFYAKFSNITVAKKLVKIWNCSQHFNFYVIHITHYETESNLNEGDFISNFLIIKHSNQTKMEFTQLKLGDLNWKSK